jgi:hypothetical protein
MTVGLEYLEENLIEIVKVPILCIILKCQLYWRLLDGSDKDAPLYLSRVNGILSTSFYLL